MAEAASPEQLPETLAALRRDNESLHIEAAHARLLLQALEALLRDDGQAEPFLGVFRALKSVFAFAHAMVLAESPEGPLECIVAEPQTLIGLRIRPGAFFQQVMQGEVSTTAAHHALPEWQGIPQGQLSPDQPGLYLPIRVRDRRGVLVLLRPPGSEGFDSHHIALARKFSLLASHALAARHATETQAESHRLLHLTEQLRASEQRAQRNADLLNEIVALLPISLTVQDAEGRFVLVNEAAAARIGMAAEHIIGMRRTDLGACADVLAPRFGAGAAPLASMTAVEETITTPTGERALLTTLKPVHFFDEMLLLSTSLDFTERKRAEDELARLAYYDGLTGLPNLALVQTQVEASLRQADGHRFALAFIDLDNFKHINAYYSPGAGDELLRAVAHRITEAIRPGDMVGRISSDEFVLLIDPVSDEDDLRAATERILKALRQPFPVDGSECFTSASIGVSLYPDHGDHFEALRRNAHSALHRAKTVAKGHTVLFHPNLGRAVAARMELEQRLRQAIRDGRFCSAFQPKVDIRSEAVVGFEALVRWHTENGTIQSPGDFVATAVELGLIDQIVQCVLADVLDAMERLDRRFGSATTFSINIAAKQANDAKFMQSFADALVSSGCPQRFMLELTEDAFLAAGEFQTHVLPILRAHGVQVSIDDFGTGYSSLSALADITADEIKVDRSFITAITHRPKSQSILKAIESLGRTLGMNVMAEGVETAEELGYLQAATDIQIAQGYYFAKPMFVPDLLALGSGAAEKRRSA